MLDQKTLKELKSKLPHRHAPAIIRAYQKRYNQDVSRFTIARFFKGQTYSEEIHRAILDVASTQQQLSQKTQEIVND